jgi:flagellar biosynthetic protein FlhB
MAEQNGQERTEEATPKRRQEARRKGTVAKSTELTNALVLGGTILALPYAVSNLGSGFMRGLTSAWSHTPTDLSMYEILRFSRTFVQPALGGFVMLLALAMILGTAANVAQVGFVISGEALKPNFAKMNPLEGFKRLFSSSAYFEAGKALVKSVVFGLLAFAVIRTSWAMFPHLGYVSAQAGLEETGWIARSMAFRVVGLWLGLAAIDYFFQRKRVDKMLRMTKEEVKQEMRQQEQSPEIRGAMIRKRRQMARGRMMQNLANADVVVTNPTHYAVAIQYDPEKHTAPVVVAKGADLLAAKIREVAGEHRIPIVPNPPLARALYRKCELGDVVPKDLFQPVAEVLAYVYKTLKRVRKS